MEQNSILWTAHTLVRLYGFFVAIMEYIKGEKMAKINIAKEMIDNHSSDEVIDYLFVLASRVRAQYNSEINLAEKLIAEKGTVDQIYTILKAVKDKNES